MTMDSPAGSRSAQWRAPECPFAIEYAVAVLDDVRLAVVDAFCSMPRGGVEIGGILLGDYQDGRVSIVNSAPLECEHALGPAFTLSPADQAKLEQQLAALPHRGNARPVGWYLSHTRSGIFLSQGDLEIYQRFFPEPWQVALVLKPHTLEPVRAGFFFRDASGAIHASASHQEFLLDPLPVRPVPGAQAARSAASPRTPMVETGRVLDTTVVESTVVEAGSMAETGWFAQARRAPEPAATETPVAASKVETMENPVARPAARPRTNAMPTSVSAEGGLFLTVPYKGKNLTVQVSVEGERLNRDHVAKVRKYLELAEEDLGEAGDA